MKENQFLGLIKFFRNEDFLEKLIEGCFYCIPPEVYRLAKQEGVSDKFESCSFSYRKSRGDDDIKLKINDIELKGVHGVTVHNAQQRDAWMHCWFTLRLPKDENSLSQLIQDIEKMKYQFGGHYAFIPPLNLKELLERLKKHSKLPFSSSEVKYTGESSLWGNTCKSLEYSYQREYRFIFGECSVIETTPYIINIESGLNDLIFKDPDIKLKSNDNRHVWLDLSA
ncbi:hypothetical protein [Dickeya undicola]|uniref:hypothetical protein n=1 Tax=Dickeya undicola TaxID=1577887 RepID=UPI000532FC15|nr:hypothetical protein [Dickeya undicola]